MTKAEGDAARQTTPRLRVDEGRTTTVSTDVASNVRASNERLTGLCCASRCGRTGTTALEVVLGGQRRRVTLCAQHAARHTAHAGHAALAS
jgi:hypothetical protein